MPAPYAVRIDFESADPWQETFETLEQARNNCTEVMSGDCGQFTSKPRKVSLLARDAGEYREVWSAKL